MRNSDFTGSGRAIYNPALGVKAGEQTRVQDQKLYLKKAKHVTTKALYLNASDH